MDLDTGMAQAYPETGGVPGDYDHRLTPLEHGVAFPGGDTARFLPWALDRPSRSVGEAWIYVPSGRTNRLWLVADDRASGGDGYPESVTEVEWTGEVTVPAVPLPAGSWPLGGVGDGVVIDVGGRLADLALFLPEEGRLRPLGGDQLVTAHGDQVVMTVPREDGVRLQLLDVRTGRRRTVDVGRYPFNSALSPDGRRLAMWIAGPGSTGPGFLQVVDWTTGEVEDVDGSAAGQYGDVAWSPDGAWVFALTNGDGDGGAIILGHHLADGRTTIVRSPSLQPGRPVAIRSSDGPDLDASAAEHCPEVAGVDFNTNPLPALSTDGPCRIRLAP